MNFLDTLEPSLRTLLIFNALPFLYFGYHAKYWYNQAGLKRFNLILGAIAIALSVLVLYKLGTAGRGYSRDMLLLTLLHLAPSITTLLILHKMREGGIAAGTSGPSIEGKSDFVARPLNKEIANLGWDDIIIDDDLRDELQIAVELLKDPRTTQQYGIEVPKGILLAGPPGTGKTTIAKVMANQAGLKFFNLATDQIISKWVGESEKNLTTLFNAAAKHAPSVIFIDEVDSIGRSRSGGGGQKWMENILNHLLQLIDGVVEKKRLYIIAATNRADLVDDALKRSGRLNRTIEVPLPGIQARQKLFSLFLGKLPIDSSVDIARLAQASEGLSGADIQAICNQAGLNAYKREGGQGGKRNFSVNVADIERSFAEFFAAKSVR